MTHPHRRGAMIAAALGLALLAAACSGSRGAGAESESAAPPAGEATFAVTLTEFAISPSQIEAPVGKSLVFNVKNAGMVQHTFAVATDSKVYETQPIDGGKSATLSVDAPDAGTYKIYCTIPGHEDAGMVGQLTVSESAPGTGTDMGGMDMGGGASPTPGAMAGAMTAEEMAQSHKAGVEAFPAETQGTGNLPLEPTIDHGVKVFELTATEMKWETEPGKFVDGMAFNGQIPGPEIRVQTGDRVRIVVQNQMSQPTTVHFHGMTVPNEDDGVPYITQDPIMPGGYYTYEFRVVDPPGMYVYHSHFNSTEQVGKGLYGAFMVEPRGNDWSSLYGRGADVESILFLGDGPLGYVLNGKGFPATSPIVASEGDQVLVHIANDGSQIHPMHLHGYHFEVVAKDAFPLKDPYMADTLMIAPGERYDVLIDAKYPGVWAFHCHILPHVEGPAGMFGMVTALVVQ